jgi:hypothetical protein
MLESPLGYQFGKRLYRLCLFIVEKITDGNYVVHLIYRQIQFSGVPMKIPNGIVQYLPRNPA